MFRHSSLDMHTARIVRYASFVPHRASMRVAKALAHYWRFALCPSYGCWPCDHKCVRPRAGSTCLLSLARTLRTLTRSDVPICLVPYIARTRRLIAHKTLGGGMGPKQMVPSKWPQANGPKQMA